ncbi:sporulation YhaL family protein [Oceanobacillus bengalensis]|uniref:SigE-dependent sporulation protein n=1 Tax=Oceanobacillus bengalensis TaxID=1435466 RepID=A0A494Z8D2_9BACI|nr:sporulation YhaL family protein [Oceanobacillus bengalensis]RKQ18870.1 SigE-dependent sporulation protein [Oceanobacillus bengalensis]
MLGVPWWVFIVIAMIFFSGYMAFRTMAAERKLEQTFIEREGKIYLERMEKEREEREKRKEQVSS